MGDGAEVEGANSSASTGPFPPPLPKPKAATLRERSPNATRCPPERPKRYSRSGRCCGTCPTGRPREALKLQESVQRKANSALKGKAVPMDLIKPPPARAKLAVDRFEVRRLLGSLAPSKEIKGKGYGKPKEGNQRGLRGPPTNTQDSDLDLVCQLPGPNTPHAKALASMVPWNRYVDAAGLPQLYF